MSTLESQALECLAVILEEGGFERAARRLNITQSAVSQRLCSLEAQVGAVLIVRSRPPKATEVGQLLVKHAKQRRLLHAELQTSFVNSHHAAVDAAMKPSASLSPSTSTASQVGLCRR